VRRAWLGVAAVLAGAAGLGAWSVAPAGRGDPVVVQVPPGADAARVAEVLYRHGLLRSRLAFRLWARGWGLEDRLQAGEYRFSPSEGVVDILRRLAAGDVVHHRVTFPEGFSARQVAERLDRLGLVDAEEFLREVGRADRHWIPQMHGNTTGSVEGYLFPDTYSFPRGLPAERAVAAMVARFRDVTGPLWDLPRPLGLSPHEVVTVASLVEREARHDFERARIAGVLYNRLRRGMPLQVDATVLYALGRHKERVLYRDLEVDSPYNTYRTAGLPPGPIANPGLASLQAALQPEAHDYLYYVARPDGTHVFSRTLAEHERARRSLQLPERVPGRPPCGEDPGGVGCARAGAGSRTWRCGGLATSPWTCSRPGASEVCCSTSTTPWSPTAPRKSRTTWRGGWNSSGRGACRVPWCPTASRGGPEGSHSSWAGPRWGDGRSPTRAGSGGLWRCWGLPPPPRPWWATSCSRTSGPGTGWGCSRCWWSPCSPGSSSPPG
jgi:UPF0755 protein